MPGHVIWTFLLDKAGGFFFSLLGTRKGPIKKWIEREGERETEDKKERKKESKKERQLQTHCGYAYLAKQIKRD